MSATVTYGRILAGQYQDSVWLMRASEQLRTRDGIVAVGIVMGTPRNLDLLEDGDLLFDGCREQATPNDIVVAVQGDVAAVEQALADAPDLVHKPSGGGEGRAYASVRAAAAAAGNRASLALISVNGEYAADEAREALEVGLDVMVFSDNVSVGDEVALKRRASELGRVVMGPDCGTAILSGVGLGFANAVPSGPVGIVAASGTGAQSVATQLAARGVGVSHLIGLGGRDLEDAVGGATLWAALAALETDPRTNVIVLVAKKTGQRVFANLIATIPRMRTPVVVCLLGPGSWWVVELVGGHPAHSLTDAAAKAAALADGHNPRSAAVDIALAALWQGRIGAGRALQGRFAGGTLAREALDVASAVLGPIDSNLGATAGAAGRHTLLDLGADEFTTNAPHPMINPAQQADGLLRALADPMTGAVLFDVVLGYGGHEDPAGVLAPVLAAGIADAAADNRAVLVVCSVCGTEDDPQRRGGQVEALTAAGATVRPTNAEAALLAALAVTSEPIARAAVPELLARPMSAVVNVGSSWFADALAEQGIDAVHVDWRPPAQGDSELRDLLRALA